MCLEREREAESFSREKDSGVKKIRENLLSSPSHSLSESIYNNPSRSRIFRGFITHTLTKSLFADHILQHK